MFEKLFSGADFMPRFMCGAWTKELMWMHIISDVLTGIAYFVIPFVMARSYYKTRSLYNMPPAFRALIALYVLFIAACGSTHFFDAYMFWNPTYRINGVARVFTALFSVSTAYSLWILAPKLLGSPLKVMLQAEQLHLQYTWLRDILAISTDNRLVLHENLSTMPQRPPGAIHISLEDEFVLRPIRSTVESLAKDAGLDPDKRFDMVTAVHEAAMNAVFHGNGGDVYMWLEGKTVRVMIRDRGNGIPLDRLPLSTLKQGYSTAGTAGQGWVITLFLIDRCHLYTNPTGVCLVLEKEVV